MTTRTEFEALIQRLADAWVALDAAGAAACFTDDAVYMQPPDGESDIRLPVRRGYCPREARVPE